MSKPNTTAFKARQRLGTPQAATDAKNARMDADPGRAIMEAFQRGEITASECEQRLRKVWGLDR
jgi:hypothetical protein